MGPGRSGRLVADGLPHPVRPCQRSGDGAHPRFLRGPLGVRAHTFPILWNLEGDVVESFSPDFYLPDLDLYLEMTTLRQKLVRKKNRKLRRLRELYPSINISSSTRATSGP